MRALITGAEGQLGRALVATVPEGWACLSLSRDQLDVTDVVATRRVIAAYSPDLVFNAAAWTDVDRAEGEEDAAFAINATAVGDLAAASRGQNAHFVHVSTDYVFDGASSRPYRPGDARSPLSAYGRSKAAGEDAAGAASTIVRTAWVYSGDKTSFCGKMLHLLSVQEEVRVVCDQIGAPTMATGLAETIWALGSRRLPGVWHHSDAGVASWYDFAVAIQEEALALGMLKQAIPVVPVSSADLQREAKRPAFSLLDSSATRRALESRAVHWRTNLRRLLRESVRTRNGAS